MERPEQFFPRIRAQLAYRLVEKYGLKKSVVAQVIGVSPSAVTQYLEGRRGSRRSEAKLEGELDSLAENIARKVELGLLEAAKSELQSFLNQLISPRIERAMRLEITGLEEAVRSLKARMVLEEEAARKALELSSKVTSPLAKLLLKQMAVDSLRHADIISMVTLSLTSDVGSSISASDASLISQMAVFESKAEEQKLSEMPISTISTIVKALLLSIDMDEEKHELLLRVALGGQLGDPGVA